MDAKVAGKFQSKKGEVVFRYPCFEDWEGMFDAINSLVEEKAFIRRQEKKTAEEQQKDMQAILDEIAGKRMVGLVAELQGRLVGWAGIGKNLKEGAEPQSGILGFVFLVEGARHAGIAENLLFAAMAEAKKVLEITRISLETCVCNRPAMKLYDRCGFTKTDKEIDPRNHYGRPVERIEMEKNL